MVSKQKASQAEEAPPFQIQATLAQFATCTLYDATLPDSTAVFLLKLLPAKSENAVLTNEFLQRVSLLAQIDHPNIAPVIDSGLTDDLHAYALLQKQTGQTVASQLDELMQDSAVSQIQFVHQIASAIGVAHDHGLIHHHLTPQNIYLTENGTPFVVDLAVPVVATTNIKSKTPITKLDYRPPEQREGKPLTPAANVYSLGIILYTLLTGDEPHLPESDWEIYDYREVPREVPLEQVRPDLAEATYTLVQTCIWQREWDRYQSMDEVLTAMDTAVAAEKQGKPKPAPPLPLPITNPGKIPPLWIAIAGAILLILCIGGIVAGRSLLADDSNTAVAPPAVIPATETPTYTPEPIVTHTPLPTDTTVATRQPTNTSTPTQTPIPTATATPTHTTTPTPTATATETTTPIATPTEEVACVPSPPSGWVRYIIQANDTLSGLATRGNTTLQRIQEVNCLEGNLLSIGATLWLPASVLPTATPTPPPPPTADNSSPGEGGAPGGGGSPGGGDSQPNPTLPPSPATVPPPPPEP